MILKQTIEALAQEHLQGTPLTLVEVTVSEENDIDKRKEYVHEALDILYKDCIYTFQEFGENIQAVNSAKWTGYEPTSRGIFANDLNSTYVNIKPVG